MIASASRSSGLDIPFLETQPVSRQASASQPSLPEIETLPPGAWIADRYRVMKKIGEGGMGVLYACLDSVLSREVAVKLMQRSLAGEPLVAERLMREARLAAQLRRHVAQVFDCGMLETGEPFIVMELLSGRDLYAVLRDSGPVSPTELTSVMLQICDGLSEAHEKGIIHRDLKPENLFCSNEPDGAAVIKIVDFGVSKQVTGERFRAQTNPTESVGSPQYMSPEQISSPSEVDTRTDIWSLGVVMFELLTGAVPFNGPSPTQVCASVLTGPVPPLSDYRSDVPPALEFIVLRCLQKSREQRFQNVAELAAALRSFDSSDDLRPTRFASARAASVGDTDARDSDVEAPRPRRRWLGGLVWLAVLGGCAAVWGKASVRGASTSPRRPKSDKFRLMSSPGGFRCPLGRAQSANNGFDKYLARPASDRVAFRCCNEPDTMCVRNRC